MGSPPSSAKTDGEICPKLQQLAEKGNLQAHHTFSPGCKLPQQWEPQTSQPYDIAGLTTGASS